jgi:hypothetical protein
MKIRLAVAKFHVRTNEISEICMRSAGLRTVKGKVVPVRT